MNKILIFFVLCLSVGAAFEIISEIFFVNVSESLPLGIYVRVPNKNLCDGNYIVYEPPDEVKKIIVANGWGDGKRDFLKKVGAIEGEKYSINAENLNFEIEGKYIGKVFEKDNIGNELPKLRGNFEVPKNCILPIATSERSFDCRYSGVISKNLVKAKVIPILTW